MLYMDHVMISNRLGVRYVNLPKLMLSTFHQNPLNSHQRYKELVHPRYLIKRIFKLRIVILLKNDVLSLDDLKAMKDYFESLILEITFAVEALEWTQDVYENPDLDVEFIETRVSLFGAGIRKLLPAACLVNHTNYSQVQR